MPRAANQTDSRERTQLVLSQRNPADLAFVYVARSLVNQCPGWETQYVVVVLMGFEIVADTVEAKTLFEQPTRGILLTGLSKARINQDAAGARVGLVPAGQISVDVQTCSSVVLRPSGLRGRLPSCSISHSYVMDPLASNMQFDKELDPPYPGNCTTS